MKAVVFFILINFSLTGVLNAQSGDSLYKKYSTGLIYRMGGSIKKGGDKISFQELAKEFSMSDLGLDQYMLAKRKRKIGTIFSFISIASGIASIATIRSNRNLGFGFLGGQYMAMMVSMANRRASTQHLDRAIWIRNKDYLFPDRRP